MVIFKLVKNGDTIRFNFEKFKTYLTSLRNGQYWVSCKRIAAKRSNPQNNLWHWWTRIIADWMGELDNEVACKHVKVKLGYCQKETDKLGVEDWVCPSTANFNVPDMSEFMMKAEILIAEMTDGKLILPRGEDHE